MGGCRCTYRNCTVKSDGQVHLFHYPVFDKLRCHQWLLNAHRLEFLDLRVSQLKNRVVCQHHFEDRNFMNYKKDKLKFDAIPTKDGPYCDTKEWNSQPIDVNKLCPIVPEDIENTYCTTYDKKTNYSLKYSDFLTNSDPLDVTDLEIKSKDILVTENPLHSIQTVARNNIVLKAEPTSTENNLNNNTLQDVKKLETSINIQHLDMTHSNKTPITRGQGSKPKIKIISEKKIRDPIPIKGKFKKVPPSIILPTPKKNSLYVVPDIVPEKTVDIENKLNNINFDKATSYVVQVEYDPSNNIQDQMSINNILPKVDQTSVVEYASTHVNTINEKDNLQITCSTPNPLNEVPTSPKSKLLRKVNLTPERKAAIDSKREFNKLLRNVIQTCLETKVVTENNKVIPETTKIEEIKKQLGLDLKKNKNVNKTKSTLRAIRSKPTDQSKSILKSTIKKANPTGNANESMLTVLEARLQTLENNVMNRIDQNAMQISELKQQLSKGPPKDTSTQTNESEESYKKFLYKEISQFLSPSCNSSIYEELFINKYSLKDETTSPKTKRKRRQ